MATKKTTAVKKTKAGTRKKSQIKRRKKAPEITPEERWHMVSVAAYYLAEKRGFMGADPAHDWIDAEAQVDAMLNARGAAG